MIAETPLVKNLENPDYMKIILGDKNSLEQVFAEVDITLVRQMLKESAITEGKIPEKIKKIIANKDLPEIILNCFRKYQNTITSPFVENVESGTLNEAVA